MLNLFRKTLSLALFLLLAGHAATAQGAVCSDAEIMRTGDAVDAARKVLLALPIGDGSETDVSPEGRQAIAAMKQRLADFVAAYFRCAPADPDPDSIERALAAASHAFKLENRVYRDDELPKEAGNYGFQLKFAVKKQPGRPRLIGVTAEFQIECGSDAVLFVFAPDEAGWKEVLRWQSKEYDTAGGAFASFGYAIAPPDEAGKWFVAAKTVAAWCSSTWSTIRYAVLRPGPQSETPLVLLDRDEQIWWGPEDFGTLKVGKRGFDLRFYAESIDLGVHSRLWIRRFRVAGDRVERIEPVAASPRDFLDEWIVSPWEEAVRWTPAKNRAALARMHERLQKLRHVDFESARKCADAADHYQIAFSHEDEPPHYYAQVRGGPAFRLAAVATKPDRRCRGKDMLNDGETR